MTEEKIEILCGENLIATCENLIARIDPLERMDKKLGEAVAYRNEEMQDGV